MANGTGNKGSSSGVDIPISTRANDRQTISVIDVISEGPIHGLVDGGASVFLNNDRVVELESSAKSLSRGRTSITLTNGSSSATINNPDPNNPIVAPSYNSNFKTTLVIRNGAGSTTVSAFYDRRHKQRLTTTSSFFTEDMITSAARRAKPAQNVPARLIGSGSTTTPDGLPIEGFLHYRATSTSAHWRTGQLGNYTDFQLDEGTYTLQLDKVVEVASISGSSVTLSATWPFPSGTYLFDSLGSVNEDTAPEDANFTQKYDSAQVSFRTGTLYQTPFPGIGNIGSTAKTQSLNLSLEKSTDFSGSQAPRELLGSSVTGFGLSSSQLEEVDLIKIGITYPGGFKAVSGKGNDKTTYIRYKVQAKFKEQGVWGDYFTLKNDLTHSGNRSNSTTFETVMSLEAFRPFEDFSIKISRKDSHENPGFKYKGDTYHDWTNVTTASITLATSVFNEKLSYPYTAMARTTFSSKDFQQMPQRTYHLRGLLVQVPSNYVTREEASNGVANYNRNVSNGDIESTYQDWNGAFRSKLVYTNNPAWIFYDILKNNRYGLGSFISADEIDKFSLYRIARYCDELVDDGKGGQEPRYTLNTYLTKEANAYKVLKDLTTNFLGMLYFLDGKILTTLDAPTSPVYNFTKANVINGAFAYESTGSKTRPNQVVVQWNNPDNNYALEPLIVEDKRNIAKTQKIITETAVAVGCTSEGQATRYGKWKLWTAANQQELVSFSTGINGSYITPGDVINVQDSDRYATRYGGRISSTGTLSTTVIPLDSDVVLNADSSYTLDVIIVEPAAFVNQASSVVIGGTTYNTGDIVPSVDTEEKSYNTTDDSGNPVSLTWKDNFRTETRAVTTSAGTVSSLVVGTAFSEAPSREDIWVLTESKLGLDVQGSAKQYKVLAISQSSKNTYDISAVEHYNEKYSAVEEDFTTYVPEALAPIVKATDIVPSVLDVSGSLILEGEKEHIRVRWIPPASSDYSVKDEDGNIIAVRVFDTYEFLQGFEISHNIPNYRSPFRVHKDTTEFRFRNIEQGTYTIAVRTINTLENKSSAKSVTVVPRPDFEDVLTRLPHDIPVGGLASISTSISTGGVFTFGDNVYAYKPPQPNGAPFSSSSTTSADYQQDCSNLPVITWSAQQNSGEFIDEHHYILFQSNLTSNPMKLLKYNKQPSHGVPYWFDAGTGSETTGTTALTGTVNKEPNRSIVTGTGTSFTTELSVGALFVVGSEAAEVSFIDSDTRITLDRASPTTYSGSSASTNNCHFDYTNDAIIARVYRTSSGFFTESFMGLDSSLSPQQAVTRTLYRKNSTVYNTTGGTFSDPTAGNTDWSLGIPTLSLNGDKIYAIVRTFTSDGKSPQDAAWSSPVIYAQRADGVDGSDGSDGVNARGVFVSTPTQAITYNAAGASPTPSSAFDITATALNTVGTPYYEFIVDGSSQQNGTGNTYSYTPPSSHSSLPDVIRVDLREGGTTGTVFASDTLSIYGVKPGTDGSDAYTVILTNEAHTLPTTNTGTVTYTGSGTNIIVYKGTTELNSVASNPTTGQFSVTTSASSITPGAITVTGNPAVVADHSNMTADSASITYSIELEGSVTFIKIQSFAKSIQGAEGSDGATGLRTIQGYLYHEKTTAGAPSAPSGNIYTFSTGLVSGTGVGTGENTWTNSPRPQDPTSTNTHYTIRYYGTEASPNSSTISVAYSDVVQYTNFTGVVTFSDGTFSKGSDTLYVSSLLPRSDESEWDLGEVTGTRGIWTRNGAGGDENRLVLEEGPHGDTSKVWKSISTDGSGADGGFQNSGTADRFDITSDTVYRFTCFVKQSQSDGTMYFGGYNYDSSGTNIGLLDYNGLNSNTNKYFWSGDLPTFNEWYLFVGFFNPDGTSLNSGKGGLYKVDTGVRAISVSDFRLNSSATKFAVRTYLYYSSTGSGTIARWAHPRVDRLDKAYPSIEQLLKPIGTGDVNNAVTSIDGGVITTGVINLGTANDMGIRQGKSGYTDTAEGFFIGNVSGDTRVNIGNSAASLKWTGSTLDIEGNVHGGSLTSSSVPTGGNKGFFLGSDGTAVMGNASKYLRVTSAGDVEISHLDAANIVGDVSEHFPFGIGKGLGFSAFDSAGSTRKSFDVELPAPSGGVAKRPYIQGVCVVDVKSSEFRLEIKLKTGKSYSHNFTGYSRIISSPYGSTDDYAIFSGNQTKNLALGGRWENAADDGCDVLGFFYDESANETYILHDNDNESFSGNGSWELTPSTSLTSSLNQCQPIFGAEANNGETSVPFYIVLPESTVATTFMVVYYGSGFIRGINGTAGYLK